MSPKQETSGKATFAFAPSRFKGSVCSACLLTIIQRSSLFGNWQPQDHLPESSLCMLILPTPSEKW
jgi:hypothetical protein